MSTTTSASLNLTESLLYALKDHGAKEVFGIPGDFGLKLFKIIEESHILPFYTLSHEPSLGFAADAAARADHGLGVVAVTYGVGALNLINAVTCAYAERSPMAVISASPSMEERESAILLHHQGKTIQSQFQIYKEITCDSVLLDDPLHAHLEIAKVLRNCREYSMPVYIEIPRNLYDAPVLQVLALQKSPIDMQAVKACAKEILDRLFKAKSPVIMLGVEIHRYGIEQKVVELLKHLEIPAVTCFMSRGSLPHDDPWIQGSYMGFGSDLEVTELVENSDSLFLLGVIPCDFNFKITEHPINLRETILAVDHEVHLGHHSYSEISLEALVQAMLQSVVRHRKKNIHLTPHPYPRGLASDSDPIHPSDIICAINDLFAEKGPMPVVTDVGDCLFSSVDIENTDVIGPAYYLTMGFGVPGGLGVQAETQKRPMILVGDGGFQMTGWELGNCSRYGWDPIVIVFNNQSWEVLRALQPESHFNDLDDWHFAEIAPSLGGIGRRVTTHAELKQTLHEAFETRGRFFLIEVMLKRGDMSTPLAQMANLVRRTHRKSQKEFSKE